MSELRRYPYIDGDVTVLGPEIFASPDGAVISWRGENYTRHQPATLEVRADETPDALRELAASISELTAAIHADIADRQPAPVCGEPSRAGNSLGKERCELPAGHDGRHVEGITTWPRTKETR